MDATTTQHAMFEEHALSAVLGFIENTEVGKRPIDEINKCDSWVTNRLDGKGGEGMVVAGG